MVELSEENQGIVGRIKAFFIGVGSEASYVPPPERPLLILTEEGERIIQQRAQRLQSYVEQTAASHGIGYIDRKIADFNRRFAENTKSKTEP